jgi:mRNA interferase YafQ
MRSHGTSNRFDREVIKQVKRGKDIEKLIRVMDCIISSVPLEKKYRDHPLSGNFDGFRECHIEPDWLLIYKIENGAVIFARTGTHSDLF